MLFEHPTNTQLKEIDFFEIRLQEVVLRVYHSFETSDGQISIQEPRHFVFLLRGYNSREIVLTKNRRFQNFFA